MAPGTTTLPAPVQLPLLLEPTPRPQRVHAPPPALPGAVVGAGLWVLGTEPRRRAGWPVASADVVLREGRCAADPLTRVWRTDCR